MSDIMKTLGDRIRYLRNEQGWSQEELAHRADISLSHMGRLERGERGATIHSLEKVTKALDISLEELFRFLSPKSGDEDTATLYDLMNKLSKRSIRDQKNILKLIDVLPTWDDNN